MSWPARMIIASVLIGIIALGSSVGIASNVAAATPRGVMVDNDAPPPNQGVNFWQGDWRLQLYGHGPLEPVLIARATEFGFAERVVIRAPVSSSQVPSLLSGFSVLVLPSLSRPNWKEQFGRVLVEAMACGVPVVGSDSGEIPNVVGDAGLRVPEGNATALRGALFELMKSERRRAELGARGRVRVLERFTNERIARATCEVYRTMMQQEGAQGAPS